jgi:hypothetical protein
LLQRCWHTEPARRHSFERIQQQFDSIVIDFMCPDVLGRSVARRLWLGDEARAVRFSVFETEFEAATRVNLKQLPRGNDIRQCLQFMLCERFAAQPSVTFERFCSMLQYLGSLTPIDQFFEQMITLFKQTWFFGFIRKEEAATLLAHALHEDRSVLGYYLMRFSCTHKGSFVLHMINRDGHLFQRMIAHQYTNEFTVALDNVHPMEYNTVFALLRDCNQCDTCLKGMLPLTTSPYTKYFKNYQIENIATYRSSDSTNSEKPRVVLSARPAQPQPRQEQQQPRQEQPQQRQEQPRQEQVRTSQPRIEAQATRQEPSATRPATQPAQPTAPTRSVQERQLAGKTISLVAAARTASASQNTSRWHSSMSSANNNRSGAGKNSSREQKNLLKLL